MSQAVDTEKGKDAGQESWLKKLGPGLITGAADDDPSGIATYSQAGAQFGYSMLWTVLMTYPLMVGIQMISAEIGRVSGHGLATNIRQHFPAVDAGTWYFLDLGWVDVDWVCQSELHIRASTLNTWASF